MPTSTSRTDRRFGMRSSVRRAGLAFELPVLLDTFRAWSPQVPGIPGGRALLGVGAASQRALAGVLGGCITETCEAGLWGDLITATDAIWGRRPVLEQISASARQVALSGLVGRRAAVQAELVSGRGGGASGYLVRAA